MSSPCRLAVAARLPGHQPVATSGRATRSALRARRGVVWPGKTRVSAARLQRRRRRSILHSAEPLGRLLPRLFRRLLGALTVLPSSPISRLLVCLLLADRGGRIDISHL